MYRYPAGARSSVWGIPAAWRHTHTHTLYTHVLLSGVSPDSWCIPRPVEPGAQGYRFPCDQGARCVLDFKEIKLDSGNEERRQVRGGGYGEDKGVKETPEEVEAYDRSLRVRRSGTARGRDEGGQKTGRQLSHGCHHRLDGEEARELRQ